MSTKSIFAFKYRAALVVATKVKGLATIRSFFFQFNAKPQRCNEAVPLEVHATYFAPKKIFKAFSNSWIFGP